VEVFLYFEAFPLPHARVTYGEGSDPRCMEPAELEPEADEVAEHAAAAGRQLAVLIGVRAYAGVGTFLTRMRDVSY